MASWRSRLSRLAAGLFFYLFAGSGNVAAAEPALISAIKAGDLATAGRLLGSEVPAPDAAANDGTTALHWAVRNADLHGIGLLLNAGADADVANRYGVTPLFLAVANADYPVVMALLDAGANVNRVLPEGETLLMTAARSGNPDIVTALIDRGAEVDAREGFYGETALIWAVGENHGAVVSALLAGGADVNGRSTRTAFARKAYGLSLLPQGDWSPLMYAARDGAVEAAEALLAGGADLNLMDPDGTTALVFAIINYHYDLAAMLLAHGADPNIADASGMNALFAAVDMKTLPWTFGRPMQKPYADLPAIELIRLLLEKGADTNARLSGPLMQRAHTNGDFAVGAGATAFMRAAKAGDTETMSLLLDYGADPNITMENGNTALMLVAGLGWRDGNMAVPTRDVGTEEEAIAAIRFCLDQGADINAVGANGNTALHVAATGRGSLKIVRFLVEQGAIPDALNESGQTALDAALQSWRDRTAVANLLRELMPQE